MSTAEAACELSCLFAPLQNLVDLVQGGVFCSCKARTTLCSIEYC
jgi:hypothetical protein